MTSETPSKKHRGAGRVPFLAHLQSIRSMVEAGWPLSAVYEKHQDVLEISYIQFTRYVGRYIPKTSNTTAKISSKPGKPEAQSLETRIPTLLKEPHRLNDASPLPDSELF